MGVFDALLPDSTVEIKAGDLIDFLDDRADALAENRILKQLIRGGFLDAAAYLAEQEVEIVMEDAEHAEEAPD